MSKAVTAFVFTATAAGMVMATASSASAGGVGGFLSPAFGTDCANHQGSHASGATTHGTGAVTGNLAGLPAGSPFNQCGGADAPVVVDDLAGQLLGESVRDLGIVVVSLGKPR
ncbi:chaplin family protein [Streptomyces cinerochromogenes]|uniref:chaplin family protein n=1 Tax=Streptomyces cinerochromogenes TaxID=66422 RepID=UPI0036C3AC82